MQPPAQVIDAFDDVQRARQDLDRLRNEADAYRNDILPRARGEAQKVIQDAEAYRERLINEAEGEAQHFLSVYNAFKQHYVDHSQYPTSDEFDLASLEPLVDMGYYTGKVTTRLDGDQADAYDAPDGNKEFWLEMTLANNPSVRFLVADSDDAPLSGGDSLDGIFLFLDGKLRPIYSTGNE